MMDLDLSNIYDFEMDIFNITCFTMLATDNLLNLDGAIFLVAPFDP